MSEEKNDNLQDADGNLENTAQEIAQEEIQDVVEPTQEIKAEEVAEIEPEVVASNEVETSEVIGDETTENLEENVVTLSDEEVADDAPVVETEHQKALKHIEDSNAEESEDETLKDRHTIPMLDYSEMEMDALVDELEKMASVEKVMSVKEHVEEIKKEFLSQYHHFLDEKKEEFLEENPDTTEEFEYNLPLKNRFDSIYREIKSKQSAHYKSLQNNLKANLDRRLAIVEEIKNLINPQENIKDTLKHFNELRDEWRNIGPIPRDKYNHVWNNYHFHVENFYDYLHLDREARDLDFKHNLEQKQKIIERVQELIEEQDVAKAFRELQDLHRIWKEDIGPVDREHREDIWNQFSELTRQMHDRREGLFAAQREREHKNLEKKNEIISAIQTIAEEKVNSHSQWQNQIVKIEALRNAFFKAGRVPNDSNEETWASFKKAVRTFNSNKNAYYKEIKNEQNENLTKKQALVEKANELKDSEDYATTTNIMKQIQEEWKHIGHVPRKYSDKIWKEFKAACNHYFEKLKAQRSEANAEEVEAFEKKKAYLETLKEFELVGDHKKDLDAIKAHIEQWKSLGRVPFTRRHVEGKFNKVLDALFDKLSLSKKESEMLRFSNKIDQLADADDSRKLESEKIFIIRKVQEVKSEILQLENNIQFFAHAKKDNPLVKEVLKNIDKHKEDLKIWKEKLKQLRNLNQE